MFPFVALSPDSREENKNYTTQNVVCALSQRANKVLRSFCCGGEWARDSEREKHCDYRAVKRVSVSLKHTHVNR